MFPKLTAVFVLSALLLAPNALGKPMPASPSGLAARAGPSGLARRAHNQAAASSAMKLAGNHVAHSGAVRRAKAKDTIHTLHKRQDPDADTAGASADDTDAIDPTTSEEVTAVDDVATDDDATADAVAPLGKRQDNDTTDVDDGETDDASDDATASGLAARAGPSGLARRAHNQAAASSAMKLAGNYVAHSGAVRRAKAKDNTHTPHKRQDADDGASADDADVDDGAADDDATADAVAENDTAATPLGKREDTDPTDDGDGETNNVIAEAATADDVADAAADVISQGAPKIQQNNGGDNLAEKVQKVGDVVEFAKTAKDKAETTVKDECR